MVHTQLNTSETLRYINHNKGQENTKLIQYLHECCFRPTPRNFLKTIKNGNFLTWTGLNNQQLLRHLNPSITTALGHMYQERKNLQSTKHINQKWRLRKTEIFTRTQNQHRRVNYAQPSSLSITR